MTFSVSSQYSSLSSLIRPSLALTLKIKVFENIGYDIETYGKYNRFLMGAMSFRNGRNVHFKRSSDVRRYLIDNRKWFKDKIIWCHNLSFDFLGTLEADLKDFSIVQRGSDFISCKSYLSKDGFSRKYKDSSYKIMFYDTLNFFKGSLKTIGELIELNKYQSPDFIGEKPKTEEEYDQMRIYNIRDAEVTRNFADWLQSNFNGLGCQIRPTIASTSMDLFKRKFLGRTFYMPKIEHINILIKAYFGGRNEIFKRGYNDEPISVYDYNSIYPTVMNEEEYPDPNTMRRLNRLSLSQIKDYEGIANVKLYCPKDVFPLIPSRQHKLIFPTGNMKGYYSNFEIRKALELGYRITDIKDGYIYKKTLPVFRGFTSFLWKKRKEYLDTGSGLQLIPKILMNGHYGKYGMRLDNKNEIIHQSELTKEQSRTADQIGDSEYFRVHKEFNDTNKPNYINPIWALYTTAYARFRLYDRMKDLDNLFYVDTDSFFTTEKLPTGDGLGDLKLEYKASEYYLVKPKFYAVRKTKEFIKKDKDMLCKIKGCRNLGQDLSSFRDIISKKKFTYEKFVKMRESLIRGFAFNEKIEVPKKFTLEDDKRDWYGLDFDMHEFRSSRPLYIM